MLLIPRRKLLKLGAVGLITAPGIIGKAEAQLMLTGAGKGPSTSTLFANLDGASSNVTLTNNLRTAQHSNTTDNSGVKSTAAKNSGKYYFEMTPTNIAGAGTCFGVCTSGATFTNVVTTGSNCGVCYNVSSGTIWSNNAASGLNVGAGAFATGTILEVAVDLDNDKVWFRIGNVGGGAPSDWNGQAIGSQNPATNTGGASISNYSATTMVPVVGFGGASTNANEIMACNFGQAPFQDTVPSGFTAGWPA